MLFVFQTGRVKVLADDMEVELPVETQPPIIVARIMQGHFPI